MPRFGKHHFLLSVFRMNDTVYFEDNFLHIFSGLPKQNFPFKLCNTDCIMPGFYKQFIFNNVYSVV